MGWTLFRYCCVFLCLKRLEKHAAPFWMIERLVVCITTSLRISEEARGIIVDVCFEELGSALFWYAMFGLSRIPDMTLAHKGCLR